MSRRLAVRGATLGRMGPKRGDVQPNLHGTLARRPRIRLYVDESKTRRWTYIGVLAVPDEEHEGLHAALESDRKTTGYEGELHFTRLSQLAKAECARRWLARARGVTSPPVRFHVLALDTHTLNRSAFGSAGRTTQDQNIYRRFLRSALAYPVLSFWPQQSAIIQAIVHDNRTVAADEYFGWHTP